MLAYKLLSISLYSEICVVFIKVTFRPTFTVIKNTVRTGSASLFAFVLFTNTGVLTVLKVVLFIFSCDMLTYAWPGVSFKYVPSL